MTKNDAVAPQTVPLNDAQTEPSRRGLLAGLFGVAGAAALSACASDGRNGAGITDPTAEAVQAFSGAENLTVVGTRADLAALSTATNICYLAESGREGIFVWTLGDLSTQVTMDVDEGIYIASNGTPSSAGAWVRVVPDGIWRTQWFAVPTSTSADGPDAAPPLTRIFNLFNLPSSTAIGVQYGPSIYNLDSALPSPAKEMTHQGAPGGNGNTILNKRYDLPLIRPTQELATARGILAFTDFGGRVADISFKASSSSSNPGPNTGGSGISSILTLNAPAAGRLVLDRVYVSGGDNFDYSLFLWGGTNSDPGGPGNRGIKVSESEFFGAAKASVAAVCVQHLLMSSVFIATSVPSGTPSPIALLVNGSSVSLSDDIQFQGVISGDVSLDWLTRSVFHTFIMGNVSNTANVASTVIQGPYISGVLQHNWTANSSYEIGRRYLDRAEVYMASPTGLVTGDGTPALVMFDTDLTVTYPVDINVPTAYQTSNGRYTATRAGYHTVSIQVLAGPITSHTSMTLTINQFTATGGVVARGTRTVAVNPSAVKAFAGYAAIGIDTQIYMDPTQCLQVTLTVSGSGTKDVRIYGSPDKYSRMEARLS